MSKTTIKKGATVNVKTKTGATYSYKFITLAQIHEWLEDNGLSYEATTKRVEDREYMFITKIDKDGNKSEPMQASRIPLIEVKDMGVAEIMQDYGSVLAMARRYSLMMVYGLAPSDDEDAPKPRASAPVKTDGDKSTRIDFDKIREDIKDMQAVELEIYKEKIMAHNMTYKQRDAVMAIFEKRRAEIMAQNMGFKPKEG